MSTHCSLPFKIEIVIFYQMAFILSFLLTLKNSFSDAYLRPSKLQRRRKVVHSNKAGKITFVFLLVFFFFMELFFLLMTFLCLVWWWSVEWGVLTPNLEEKRANVSDDFLKNKISLRVSNQMIWLISLAGRCHLHAIHCIEPMWSPLFDV